MRSLPGRSFARAGLAGPLHPCPGGPAEEPPAPPALRSAGHPPKPVLCRHLPSPRDGASPPSQNLPLPKSPLRVPRERRASTFGEPLPPQPPPAGAAGWAGAQCRSRGIPAGSSPAPPRDAGSAAAGPPPYRGPRPPTGISRWKRGWRGFPQLSTARYLKGSTAAQAGTAQNRKRTQ